MDVLPHTPVASQGAVPPVSGGQSAPGGARPPRGPRRGARGGSSNPGGDRPPPSALSVPRGPAQQQQQQQQRALAGRQGGPSSNPQQQQPAGAGGRRRANFGGRLTTATTDGGALASTSAADVGAPAPPANGSGPKRSRNRSAKVSGTTTPTGKLQQQNRSGPPSGSAGPRPAPPPPPAEDASLATRLTYSLSHPPYADCSICFGSIHPAQPTWSCGPAPSAPGPTKETPVMAGTTCCWGVYHLKCIKEWAEGSIKGGEEGGWRCPGCQTKRSLAPRQYTCFCQSTISPSPPRLSTPHSCASPCTRPRPACAHPCPLDCHPGPCPPCKVELRLNCGSHGEGMLVRCGGTSGAGELALAGGGCGKPCGKRLACGKADHVCAEPCHAGACLPCAVEEVLTCFCGSDVRVGACNELAEQSIICSGPTHSVDGKNDTATTTWVGRYACDSTCPQTFACGLHPCDQLCHPHPAPPGIPCPLSPSNVHTCPCGKAPLASFPSGSGAQRQSCKDKVPTCGAICGKEMTCGHACAGECHEGPCGPCRAEVVLPCRCGESKVRRLCWQRQEEELRGESEVRCETRCSALRSCRKHECGRLCCPLAYKASSGKGKGKRRQVGEAMLDEEDEGEWHTCQLVCGKPLACGNHTCPALDHKGPCPPCLMASYDELVCHCNRTVILPPIACGRTFDCTYPCVRPPPACGHPKVPHSCHESERCPPCVFLTERECACGKNTVKNTRCSQTKVSCGVVCGELLACGWHRCEKTCHSPGECEACTKPCGKPRRYCGHACAQPCHSPASCDLSIACGARVTQRCACGRREQQAVCSASSSSPSSKAGVVLKCSDDCHKAARNERLALALGISPDRPDRSGAVEWSAELQAQGLALGSSFVALVEKALADFIQGPRATQILPHMPVGRREFVAKLAEAYRVDTSLVDQEPSRSVQLRRRVDSRVPTAGGLLSAAISAGQAPTTARSRLNTSRPTSAAATTTSGPPAWGAASSSLLSAAKPSSTAPLVSPVPRSWGTVPSARASAAASPAASRTGSPYVPPGRRADDPASVPAPAAAPAPVASNPVAVDTAVAAAVASVQALAVGPAEVDDTWEQSDEEP